MEPAERIIGSVSQDLAGKRIVLGVTGSIGAVKNVEIARALIRHGAQVLPVMTRAAAGIVTPDAMRFATGHDPIVRLTGKVEHVSELGDAGDADLLLVCPATANTLAKIALGIDDTPVTTCATVALGAGRPVVVVPAMHGPMEEHPVVQQHQHTLRALRVHIVRPKHEEGKAKVPDKEEIVAACARALGPNDLRGRKALVVTGAARVNIDPVRTITNRSSGRMGQAVANELYRRGADVTVWTAPTDLRFHPEMEQWTYDTMTDLIDHVADRLATLSPDLVLVPAALVDHGPEPAETKRSSDVETQTLELHRIPKVLALVRQQLPKAAIVGWKLQDTLKEAVPAAHERLERYEADIFVANGRDALDQGETNSVIVDNEGEHAAEGSKRDVARQVIDRVLLHMDRSRSA